MGAEEFITKHMPGCPRGDPGALRTAAQTWTTVSSGLRSSVHEARTQIRALSASWTGEARDAFDHEWSTLAVAVDEGCDQMVELAHNLESAADKLAEAQHAYEVAVGAATVAGVAFVAGFLTFGATEPVAGVAAEGAIEAGEAAALIAAEATAAASIALSTAVTVAQQIAVRFVVFLGVDLAAQAGISAIVYDDHDPFGHINIQSALSVAGGMAIPGSFGTGVMKNIVLSGATSAAFDAGLQKVTTGRVDRAEVLFSGALAAGGAAVFAGAGRAWRSTRATQPLRVDIADLDRSLTRKEWKALDSRNRAELTVSRFDRPLENPKPKSSRSGHGHGRHGHQTTDAQQATRISTGIAPDGDKAPTSRASRFRNATMEAEAVGRGRTQLEQDLRKGDVESFLDPGTGKVVYVDPGTGFPVNHSVEVGTDDSLGFGDSAYVTKKVGGKVLRDASGNKIPVKIVGPQMHARIVWQYVPSIDDWRPLTYYPRP